MKKAIIAGLVIVTLVGIALVYASQNGKAIPEPEISVKVGAESVKPIYYGDRYNKSREELEGFLSFAFENGWESIPYVEIGDEAVIQFENFDSDKVEITEALLTQEGKYLYNEKSDISYEVEVTGGEVRFEIPSNPAVYLSSNSDSYLPGHVIRAIFVRADIYDSDFVFAFVIRTNP